MEGIGEVCGKRKGRNGRDVRGKEEKRGEIGEWEGKRGNWKDMKLVLGVEEEDKRVLARGGKGIGRV